MRSTRVLIIIAAVTVGLSAGCQTSHEIGKSTKQLVRGETGCTVEQSPAQVSQAIDNALADLKLIRINATVRPTETKSETIVVARDTQDTRIQIAYVPVSATSTRVVVSTGAFGNSELRDKVWDAVRIRMGVIAMTPATASASVATPVATPVAATPSTQPTVSAAQPAATQPAVSTPTASTGY